MLRNKSRICTNLIFGAREEFYENTLRKKNRGYAWYASKNCLIGWFVLGGKLLQNERQFTKRGHGGGI